MKWKWKCKGEISQDPQFDQDGKPFFDVSPPKFTHGIILIEWRIWQNLWRKKHATWVMGSTPQSSWPTGGSKMSSWDEKPVLKAVHQARSELS